MMQMWTKSKIANLKSKMTRHLLILIFVFLFATAAMANAGQQQPMPAVQKDTSIVNDSLARFAVNDPKKIFKDIFLVSPTGASNTVQLNPRAASFVQDYMTRHSKHLQKMKDWALPYFNMIDGVLTSHGVPNQLKYLAVIESNMQSYALSWAGAVGPWQFMPATARRMGLKVNSSIDERTDYYKSTHAAARYLTELYSIYKDWLLVIAAYNGGPGNVDYAIRRSGSRNFWDLQNYLPEESRNHVKKFIATHYIMEGDGSIATVTKQEAADMMMLTPKTLLTKEEIENSTVESISGRYNSIIVTQYILMDISSFNRYNPDFDRQMAIAGIYQLRLPRDKMKTFLAKKNQILEESLHLLLGPLNKNSK
jgi:membrane-bound lytic murein transglycosylase D